MHAAGQIVSVKMIIENKDIIEKINASLPPQIRVWGYARTNRNFHAKNRCDSRIYEYVFPTYVLQPCNPNYYPFSKIGQDAGMTIESMNRIPNHQIDIEPSTPEELERKRSFRISLELHSKLKETLQEYQGSHNFYNFTIGKKWNDKNANRHILNFQVF